MARPLLEMPAWMSRPRQALGKLGEDLACRELERRGWAILARRYRRRGGELDIVARDGQTVVFVEVKTREGSDYGAGVEAITALKRRRLADVALDYVVRNRLHKCPCRFDVASIEFGADGVKIEWYQNAFDVG